MTGDALGHRASLPAPPGWSVAVLAACPSGGGHPGEDFHDWFERPDRALALAIGRRAGAAVSTEAILAAARAAVLAGDGLEAPPDFLARSLVDATGRTASLCVLLVTPASGAVRVAGAGFPAPLVRRPGRRQHVRLALGEAASGWSASTVVLDPGDLFLVGSDLLGEAVDGLPGGISATEAVLQVDLRLRRIDPAYEDRPIAALAHRGADHPGAPTRRIEAPTSLRLEPRSTAPAEARRLVRQVCARLGVPDAVTNAAQSVVSELVTNAVFHARTPVEVRLSHHVGVLRIDVADESPDPPVLVPGALGADHLLDAHGRGLAIAASLVDQLGVEVVEGGKVVWAEIGRPPPS